MLNLFIDLDNTLIYSHHKKLNCEKLVAEYIEDKEQSYITKNTYNFIRNNRDKIKIIPVTMRNVKQYFRLLRLFKELNISESIICNGALLMKNEMIDKEWFEESSKLIKDDILKLNNICEYLNSSHKNIMIKNNFNFVFCIIPHNKNNDIIYKDLLNFINCKGYNVNTYNDGRKIYFFSAKISKGNGLIRKKANIKNGYIVAAGDSEMDISLLNEADISIATKNIYEKLDCKNKILCNNESVFSDQVCEQIYKYILK